MIGDAGLERQRCASSQVQQNMPASKVQTVRLQGQGTGGPPVSGLINL